MPDTFKVGHLVQIRQMYRARGYMGVYEIVRTLPPDVSGVPLYHAKSPLEGHERVLRENEIEATRSPAERLGPPPFQHRLHGS